MSRSNLVIRAAAGLALMWLLAPALQAQDVDAGLVARYAFDGDVADDGPNGYNGRVVGSPSYERGLLGQGIRLDGSADALQFLNIPNANWNGPFSAAWFMQVDTLEDYSLLSKRDACTGGNFFDVQLGNNAPDLIGFELARAAQIGTTVARATANDGPWIHVAIVRDATSARVYVDGRAGASVNVGTLNFSSVVAPLEFGGSPCVGAIGGPRRYRGMIDELRVYDRALSAAEVDTLSRVTGLSVTPGSGSPGTRITMRMTNLEAGRTYDLRLRQGRTVNTLLTTVANATVNDSASATVPAAAPGSYEIALLQRQPLQIAGGTLVRTTPFTVGGGLTFSNITPQPQAGKRMQVTVGNLAPGSLQLKYNGRIVSGPSPVTGTSSTLRFMAPADIPTSFPATVTLRAELLSGRAVIRTGTTTITVTAPFTGPFAITSGVTSSNAQPRPAQPIRISGQLALADGATVADVDVSAYWVGNNGTVTPLPTSALSIANNGTITLDTESASFSSMTAFTRTGPGRLRLVTSRFNTTTGRRELELTEGPNINPLYDTDLQTDITLRVRALTGNGNSVALSGAYAVLDANAPVQLFTPPAPAPNGDSPYLTGGPGLVINSQPAFNGIGLAGLSIANQLQNGIQTLPLPAPECGNSLFRRYTDATGRAEFLIQGDVQGSPGSWQALQSTTMAGSLCDAGGCAATEPNLNYEFYLTVYTVHLGAGYRETNNSNVEIPSRFRIRYDRNDGTFEIRNERTGVTTTQQVSANILLEVPAFTQLNGFVTISDPLVFQTLGTDYYLVRRIGTSGYGKWVDFAGIAGSFASAAPVRTIRFAHKPDAGGSISTAKLYLPNNNNGNPSVVGTFDRITNVTGCNLQEDGSFAGTETWELKIDGPLAQSWRFPRGVYFRTDASERKACGYIEAINVAGGSGRRNICFYWQKLPDSLTEASGTMVVDDANPDDVRFERSAQVFNDRETEATLPATIDGEPVQPPRRRDNQTRTVRGSYDRMTTQGVASSTRSFDGANPKQFAKTAGGRTSNSNLSDGGNIVEIGEDEYQTIVDETIPLFSWTWGVPELFGAQVYADLRLLADYYFYGELRRQDGGGERLDMTTDASFAININVGVDIDVLFGLFFDAGAYITGYARSTMPTVITNNAVTRSGPCFYFGMTFTGYFDPCNLCPTPVIEETYPIINTQTPSSCEFYDGTGINASVLAAPRGEPSISPVTALEQRQLHRHPAIAFGEDGNGQMMMLDSAQALTVTALENGLQTPRVLSSGLNARQPQIVYYAPNRAVAVWAESALTLATAQGADITTLARNQRLMYSLYNGAGWSSKRQLTAPGNGEAFPALAACHAGAVGCPAGGEVIAVWQRDQSGTYRAPTNRLWQARYAPATGWTAVSEVARDTGSLQDITPSVTYLGANPLVVWVRQDGADLSNFARRSLAYRIIGVGNPQVVSTLPTGVIAPSVRALSALSAMVAFTKVDVGTGPIGTRQALHTATVSCFGTCTWSWRRVLDRFDRAIYGERPQMVAGAGGDASIVMRAFQFRGDNGEPVQQGDPFGTVVSSGDLINIQPGVAGGRARTVAITADGASHFGAVAAYNPMSEEITTVAATYLPQEFTAMRAAVKAAGFESQVGYGKALAAVGGVEVNALPAAPDLGVESVSTNVALVAPSTAVQATVRIGNRGTVYNTARDGNARIELRWNMPTGTGAPLASANIASLGAGESRDVVLNFTTPANAFGDEEHTLYAIVIPADDQIELSGDNNVGSRKFDGLPVPFDIATFSSPGMAPVQMGWSAATDARVAGYRVYRLDGTEWVALGSSPSKGFLDLSAQFGVSRTYAVSTYSVRGAESERSAPVSAMPTIAEPVDDALLVDGFESPGS